ncbi:hypothetical protein [Nocardiopsis protaetiae]|uniref:hypothetical protein n=1 Tax=Nocardiopsis protaetiae TaxID=3382270 RepID=UPI00387B75BE
MSLPSPTLPSTPVTPAPPRTFALVREGLQHGGGALVAAAAVFVLPGWVLLGVVMVGEELYPVDPAAVGPLDGIGLAAGLSRMIGLPMLLVFAVLLGFGHRVGRPVGPGGALLGTLRRLPALLMWVLLSGAVPGVLLLAAAAPALLSGLSLPGIAVSAVLVLLCLPVAAAVYLSLPTAVLHGTPLGVGIRDSWRLAKGRRTRSLLVLLSSAALPFAAYTVSVFAVLVGTDLLGGDAVLGAVLATAVQLPPSLFLEPVAALIAASLAVPRAARG